MSLPSAYATISPVSFYPDKVTLNYQFENSFSQRQLSRCLYQNGFRNRDENAWAGAVHLRVGPARPRLLYPLHISRPRHSAPLNLYLHLNILREVYALATDRFRETPTVEGDTNFVPAHLVQPDNRWLWRLMDDLITQGLDAVSGLVAYIHDDTPRANAPRCSHVSVASIEAAIDFQALNPRHLVRTYSRPFGALLRDVEHREYLNAANRIVRPEADWMVHGFIANDDRIKVYAKTNRRVRWEYRFGSGAFDRLNVRRSLASGEASFAAIFAHCADQASQTFSALRARTPCVFNINRQCTPIRLLSKLAGCTRDEAALCELLDCLVYTDKIDHSLFARGLIARLRRRGLLQPSLARGFSCISLDYIRALEKLRRAQQDYFTTRLLRSISA